MNLSEIEYVSRFAWPALEEQELSFGVLRYSAGVNRRSNSLNVFIDANYDHEKLVEITELFFAQRHLPAIVRVLNIDGGSRAKFQTLDDYLADNEYRVEAPTRVLSLDLRRVERTQSKLTSITSNSCEQNCWLRVWYKLSGFSHAQFEIHQEMLSKIRCATNFLVLINRSGDPVSCGMAALSNSALGIFGIATHKDYRGRGYAVTLVQSLLQWGEVKGARYAFLQVEAVNSAALALYHRLGFTEFYSYWYRVKELH